MKEHTSMGIITNRQNDHRRHIKITFNFRKKYLTTLSKWQFTTELKLCWLYVNIENNTL